ncbi:hypothetical protein FFLO_07025 [Filobasidium floriforme]|uniref:Uncharacterized protein n=1 Tax=Filobasidium floriforme TaxID=5210 RepID=A0A8K0NMA2_9TREE|nr:hypothetical protein FFLO_07025 [Filobasidium floriforme]
MPTVTFPQSRDLVTSRPGRSAARPYISTLYDSLKAEGREKGIVKEFWRVTRG